MMGESWPMLLGLVFMAALAGLDALRDRSSRRPLSWREFRPDGAWWARRHTKRERARAAISVGEES